MLTLAQRQVRGRLGKPVAVTLDGVTHHVKSLGGKRKVGVQMDDSRAMIVTKIEIQMQWTTCHARDRLTFEGAVYRVGQVPEDGDGMQVLIDLKKISVTSPRRP